MIRTLTTWLRARRAAAPDRVAKLRADADAAMDEALTYPPASPQRHARVCRSYRLAAEARSLERAREGCMAAAADADATAKYWAVYEAQYEASGEMASA